MPGTVTISPYGPSVNRKAVLPALVFGGLILILGWRLSLGGYVLAVLLGLLGAGAAVWWLDAYAKASRVEQVDDQLILFETRSRRRVVGRAAKGKAMLFSDVRGGVAGHDSWLMWFDEAGGGTWTSAGRRWPLDLLVDACGTLGIPVQESSEPQSTSALRQRYPSNVRWIEAHTTAAVLVATIATMLVLGFGLALLGIQVPR